MAELANTSTLAPTLLTIKQAAARLGISRRTLERERTRGRIKTVGVGTGRNQRVRVKDIEAYEELISQESQR